MPQQTFKGVWPMAITEYITLLVDIFAQLGYPGIFVLMVMESATLPVPSEIVLPLGGYLVYQRRLEFWSVVAVATLGSLIGGWYPRLGYCPRLCRVPGRSEQRSD